MLVLIFINVQYFQNVVFRLQKCLNGQNHSSWDSSPQIKTLTHQNFEFRHWEEFLLPLNAIYKILLREGILTHPMLTTAAYQFSTQTSPWTSIVELGSWPGWAHSGIWTGNFRSSHNALIHWVTLPKVKLLISK